MTKKSAGRQMRDAAKKNQETNTCWDDLADLQKSMAGLLVQHIGISTILRDKELMLLIEDKQSFISNVQLLTKDLKDMGEELAKLHALHKDKKGGSLDPDEVLYSISILEQYNLFMQRHQAVILPTALHITEQITAAEIKREELRTATVEVSPLTPAQTLTPTSDLLHRPMGEITDLEVR